MAGSHQPDSLTRGPDHAYRAVTRMIERLHRLYLDVIRAELDRLGVGDISAVQALLLTNIGDAEVNVRTLTERGYYQGSNASYNLKKLVEAGYIEQFKSSQDRRATIVRLTRTGRALSESIAGLEADFAEVLDADGYDLAGLLVRLEAMERGWSKHIRSLAPG